MENYLPETVKQLIEKLKNLPGVGEKTAQRFAFFLLKKEKDFLKTFGETLGELKEKIKECSECFNFSEEETCKICQSNKRDRKVICVIENPFDLISIEKSGKFGGVYHILHGVLSPIDGIGPNKLKIKELVDRLKNSEAEEVILALNPSLEGEATITYILRKIREEGLSVKVSTLAKGISVGGDLEYTDELTIGKAFEHRLSL